MLPKSFLKANATDGTNIKIYGQPISEMTREELMAVINFLGDENIRHLKEHQKTIDIVKNIINR